MKLKNGILSFGAGLLPAVAIASGFNPERVDDRPNILLIVSDDQGYADAGFNGRSDIPTPNLDALALTGVICTNGYVSGSVSSPTRAGLITGRYQQRIGYYSNIAFAPDDETEGLPVTEKILPQLLKEAGYITGWIGKWHLGMTPQQHPSKRGFDETFGFQHGGHNFINWTPDDKAYTLPIKRNGIPEGVKEHLTIAFGKEAVSFINRNNGRPWFLYLAFNAPHTPHQPLPDAEAKFSGVTDETRRKYSAQLSMMDDQIGEILMALQKSGQIKNTLIFFFSDNGGPLQQGAVNTPLRGSKGSVYEGGFRVPFIVSWPSRLDKGVKYEYPVSSLDVLSTSVINAGLRMPADKKYDGVDLIPYLQGKIKGRPHQTLYWKSANSVMAIRDGDWKMVRYPEGKTELYDLASDISESKNLFSARPEVVKQLTILLDTWNSELPAPGFLKNKSRTNN